MHPTAPPPAVPYPALRGLLTRPRIDNRPRPKRRPRASLGCPPPPAPIRAPELPSHSGDTVNAEAIRRRRVRLTAWLREMVSERPMTNLAARDRLAWIEADDDDIAALVGPASDRVRWLRPEEFRKYADNRPWPVG